MEHAVVIVYATMSVRIVEPAANVKNNLSSFSSLSGVEGL